MTAWNYEIFAVVTNLRKAWKIWACMTRILCQEGVELRVSGFFSKAVVQAVLLFGSEAWILTPCIEQALGVFQHRVVWQITGRQTRRRGERGW